ncbi:hypothetical protein C8Q80DRAFT_1273330 [Daedaleopsis nitida]|nr:hypothetical protein C8Q80DRAFT_1273330 [Daedaleopsis nitida]
MMNPLLVILSALVAASCLVWLFNSARKPPQPQPRPPGFVFYATTTVRAHATTNLQFSIPHPPDFHHDTPATIGRNFGAWLAFVSQPVAWNREDSNPRTPVTAFREPHPQPGPSHVSAPPTVIEHAPALRRPRRQVLQVNPIPPQPTSSGAMSQDSAQSFGEGSSSAAGREGSFVSEDDVVQQNGPEVGHQGTGSPLRRPDSQDANQLVYTYWFATQGQTTIRHPPDFNQDDLQLGDLFYHRTTQKPKSGQLWLWIDDRGIGPYWKRVEIGYRREDGRRLSLSQVRKSPSWVREEYFMRRTVESRLCLAGDCNGSAPSLASSMYGFAFVNIYAFVQKVLEVSIHVLAISMTDQTRRRTSCLAAGQDALAEFDAPLEYRLSDGAIRRLSEIREISEEDDASRREDAYADALEELRQLNECNAALFKAVLRIQQTQSVFDKSLTRIEEEVATVKHDIGTTLRPVKKSYRQAQVALRAERRSLENVRVQLSDDIQDLQGRNRKLEVENGRLRVLLAGAKTDIGEIHDVLSAIQTWAGKTDTALEQLEEDTAHMRVAVTELQEPGRDPAELLRLPNPLGAEDVHSLPSSPSYRSLSTKDASSSDSSPGSANVTSLADEFADLSSWEDSSKSCVSEPVGETCAPFVSSSDLAEPLGAVQDTNRDTQPAEVQPLAPPPTPLPLSQGVDEAHPTQPSEPPEPSNLPRSAPSRPHASMFGTTDFVTICGIIVLAHFLVRGMSTQQREDVEDHEHRYDVPDEHRKQIVTLGIALCASYCVTEIIWHAWWNYEDIERGGSSGDHPIWEAVMRD